jgi:flavin-dependent dehydrogenase
MTSNPLPIEDRFQHSGCPSIIGSGFGGSVAALKLAQAGIYCFILERGHRWSITPAENTFAALTERCLEKVIQDYDFNN